MTWYTSVETRAPAADPLGPLRDDLEAVLRAWLEPEDEANLDAAWQLARSHVRELALRPAKRVRPLLVALGWTLARPTGSSSSIPPAVTQFGAGLELLHTFMLIHDDVADRACSRRGGPALHRLLGSGRRGEDLAIVAGDHLYARALEAMFTTRAGRAAEAVRYVLEVCRHTAAGQYLDLVLAHAPLGEVTLFRTLKVAELKTARYGFVAPLVCGAMLGDASEERIEVLKRVGRHAGLAFQLRDDLIGLVGEDAVAGKSGGADYLEGKRSFPLIAAWTRANAGGRRELEELWEHPASERLSAARAALARWGGLAATQRVVQSRTRAALKALELLGDSPGALALASVIGRLEQRVA